MFKAKDCNYRVYQKIIDAIISTNKYMDYSDALYSNQFIVLRHDIEFSIERAYRLSCEESENNFNSSYFVQLTSNAYNCLSKKNIEFLREMSSAGHKIGLHYHRGGLVEISKIKDDIQKQVDILSEYLGFKIDRFSFHRPLSEHLKANVEIPGLINTYSKHFFTFVESDKIIQKNEPKYIADSNHQWKYGLIDEHHLNYFEKIQILIHPMSWTEKGETHTECFQDIIAEKKVELVDTIRDEWKLFHLLEGEL